MLVINLKPEVLFLFFNIPLTNTFLTTLLVDLLLVFVSISFYYYYTREVEAESFFVKIIKVLVYELLKIIDSVTRDRKLSKMVFGLIATLFIFIAVSNLLALIPGFLGSFYILTPDGKVPLLRSPNSDLTLTLSLAIISLLSTQYFSLKILGWNSYLKRFFNFSSLIKFILGFFELISELIKLLSFSFRLFGNVFAGEVLLLVLGFLIPYFIPLPFMILEVFVGVIQAFIFSVLTLTFIKIATLKV